MSLDKLDFIREWLNYHHFEFEENWIKGPSAFLDHTNFETTFSNCIYNKRKLKFKWGRDSVKGLQKYSDGQITVYVFAIFWYGCFIQIQIIWEPLSNIIRVVKKNKDFQYCSKPFYLDFSDPDFFVDLWSVIHDSRGIEIDFQFRRFPDSPY